MNISKLLDKVRSTGDCQVFPAVERSRPKNVPNLPADVREFYEICDGVIIYGNSDCPFRILNLADMRAMNAIILGDAVQDDPSDNWYAIGESSPSDYVGIDLSSQRLGNYFDCRFDTYGLVGEMPILARSLDELLLGIIGGRGESYYWQNPTFQSLGDAYD